MEALASAGLSIKGPDRDGEERGREEGEGGELLSVL